ncbi:MAG TPA: hypothetical protein VM577_15280 [Anaerovoracaceae bacterium]|nr:hypothetical protein [Anaerovoracaceae bacterium]
MSHLTDLIDDLQRDKPRQSYIVFECNPLRISEIRRIFQEKDIDIEVVTVDDFRCKLTIYHTEQTLEKLAHVDIQKEREAIAELDDLFMLDDSPFIGLTADRGFDLVFARIASQRLLLKFDQKALEKAHCDDEYFLEDLSEPVWGHDATEAIKVYDVVCGALLDVSKMGMSKTNARSNIAHLEDEALGKTVTSFSQLFDCIIENTDNGIEILGTQLKSVYEKHTHAYTEIIQQYEQEKALQEAEKEEHTTTLHTGL